MNFKSEDKFYVTTPIYYVNDVPHIGHAYTTIIADTIARYKKLNGKNVYFLTGTDEHGQKIEQAALKKSKTPKEYADEISSKFRSLWDDFDICYDKYIRTTDEEHKLGVQKAFEKMYAKGDIYKSEYEGHYCVSCETFFTETQLEGKNCPDCGKETSVVKEESYFFRLSNYQDRLVSWYKDSEDCILPKSRKNEVLKFVESGLNDLSITRTSFDWGVKLPDSVNDPKHVVYVWLDALMNYTTALGYGEKDNLEFWPANYHIIGKDILRFHAIFWPAFLMSLDLALPIHVAAHGWWTRNGAKMSKSLGNVINPKEVADAYGLDNFRYFLLREVPFGQDGDFGQRAMIDRINNDLGNDLGNLLNRIIGMSDKYFDLHITSSEISKYFQQQLNEVDEILSSLDSFMNKLQLNKYLEELWRVLSIGNKLIETVQPWAKMKDGNQDEVKALLGFVANTLAKVALYLNPIMPKMTAKLADALNFEINSESYEKFITKSTLLDDFVIKKIPPLFPKIEDELMQEVQKQPVVNVEEKKDDIEEITIDQFFKTVIKVGSIISGSEVDGSKKLYILKVDLNEGRVRQIVAGIKEYYKLEELIGTKVCVVSNLKPAKLMGNLSEGMILAAKDKNGLKVIRPSGDVEIGTKIS